MSLDAETGWPSAETKRQLKVRPGEAVGHAQGFERPIERDHRELRDQKKATS